MLICTLIDLSACCRITSCCLFIHMYVVQAIQTPRTPTINDGRAKAKLILPSAVRPVDDETMLFTDSRLEMCCLPESPELSVDDDEIA